MQTHTHCTTLARLHANTHTLHNTCTLACKHTHITQHTHAYMQTHTSHNTRTLTCKHTHHTTHARLNTNTNITQHTHARTYAHTYTHTHTHVHTCTHARTYDAHAHTHRTAGRQQQLSRPTAPLRGRLVCEGPNPPHTPCQCCQQPQHEVRPQAGAACGLSCAVSVKSCVPSVCVRIRLRAAVELACLPCIFET